MDASAPPQVRIDSYLDGSAPSTLARDVREGLSRELRELPPKYFYDARGSELFEGITRLPEYYPTRCERWILNRRAPEIAARSGVSELAELGSGSASKTRALLYAMAGAGALRRYVPFDVSEAAVEACARELVELYPGLEVHGVVGDFERDLERLPEPDAPRLTAFLGGTIGNLHPEDRARFVERLAAVMRPEDRLLLGVDLVKDRAVLEAAYNDSAGITAEFNRNVLRVLNRELGADFDPDSFEHVAFFDPERSWIEMRLRARGSQTVNIDRAGLELELGDGEEIRTEISAKFTPDGVRGELAAAGLRVEELFTDPGERFAVALAGSGGP
ncbi:MAG: L-histidine N(alpha)-methyltransferase [Actinomycetota bacterium]|nr:L-histidine N(alpha)-methyltransferase [Actinomycetota bacterium]